MTFEWKNSTATGNAVGPSLHLLPHQTQEVDVAALQNTGVLPMDANWAEVKLTTTGKPGDIMAIASSYDKTLKYGAQTPFSDQLAFHWVGSIWEYDSTHDSIIAVGNGGTKPAEAAFTLTYNHGAGAYEIDQMLQPDQQVWIDVGQLIRSQVPDKNGVVLPVALSMGSYEIRQLNHHGPGTLFEGKVIYDKTYGSVTYGCSTCCGYTASQFDFFYDPLGIPLDGEEDQGVEGYDTCYGEFVDVTSDFDNSWTTANHAIATVNAYGVHKGVATGSTTTNASADEQIFNERQDCPIEPVYPTGNDNVTPQVLDVSCTPQDLALGPTAPTSTTTGSCTANVTPDGGSYSWSANVNTVTINNPTVASPSFTSANPSTSLGDTTIKLTYTVNGQQATGQSDGAITVHKPTSLTLDSTTFNGAGLCPSGQAGWERDVNWQVLDQLNQAIPIAGLPAVDQINIGSPNSCGASPQTGTGYTASDGTFPDKYTLCSTGCPAGCQTNASQTYTVAGVPITPTISIVYACNSITLNGE